MYVYKNASGYSHNEYSGDTIRADSHPSLNNVIRWPYMQSTAIDEATRLDILTMRNEVRADLSEMRTDIGRQLEQLTNAVVQLAKIEPMIDTLKRDHIELRKNHTASNTQLQDIERKLTILETKFMMWMAVVVFIVDPIIVITLTKLLGK
jgi:septal ring factor EnvC (AmiA/AmiB activator)